MDHENDTAWVRGMLYPGENLLWSGKPGKGHLLRKKSFYAFPFSLIWFVAVVYFFVTTITSDEPLSSKLLGIVFMLVALTAALWRFIYQMILAKKSRYALTSQRIIIKVGKVTKSLDLNYLPRMTVTRFADGNGDIRFGDTTSSLRDSTGYERSYYADALAELRNIPDVNNVEYRIRTAVEQALRARRSDMSE